MGQSPGGAEVCTVWSVALDVTAAELDRCRGTLAPDERARAARLLPPVARARFVAARAALRLLLGEHLSASPEAIAFAYSPAGKPRLAGPLASSGVEFSLSHSEGLMLLAVSRGRTLGVDIEALRPLGHLDAMARRHLAPPERVQLAALPDVATRTRCFLTAWTAKEAYLKAEGTGLGLPPAQVELDMAPGRPPALRRVPEGAALRRAQLSIWTPRPGFVAALVVEGGPGFGVSHREWVLGAPAGAAGPVGPVGPPRGAAPSGQGGGAA